MSTPCTKEDILKKLQSDLVDVSRRTESTRKYATDIYKKLSDIILNTSTPYGKDQYQQMYQKSGKSTLIEAIVVLCDRLEEVEDLTAEEIIEALGYTPADAEHPVTAEQIIEALGYTPAVDGGSNFVIGRILD